MALDPKITRHKLLLTTISDEFDQNSDEYHKFLEHFKGYVGKGILAGKKTLLDKFGALASKGYLGPGKYDVLKEICKGSGNEDILKLIEDAEEDIRNLDKNSGSSNGQRSTSTGQSKSSGHETINDHPESKRARTDGDLDNPDPLYRRHGKHLYWDNRGRKGLLLILNFKENRPGTDLDVQKLKEFFGPDGLKFQVWDPREDEEHDLTISQVNAALKAVQNKLNAIDAKSCYYCFVCVILSHGDEVGIKTRGDSRKPIEEIQKSFDNKNVPNFAGRPKLFFIQACRGSMDQDGQHIDLSDDELHPKIADKNLRDEADEIINIPADADTLTAYATTLGYRSFRREGIGSWFITECINVFKDDHEHDHVEEMLITVRERVANNWVKTDGTKQMPCVNSTFTRRLMFTKSE